MAVSFTAMLIPAFLSDDNSHIGGTLYSTLAYFAIFGFALWSIFILYRIQEKIAFRLTFAIVALCLFWLLLRFIK
jgi:hypothetical protein